jgi:hypothetical protein
LVAAFDEAEAVSDAVNKADFNDDADAKSGEAACNTILVSAATDATADVLVDSVDGQRHSTAPPPVPAATRGRRQQPKNINTNNNIIVVVVSRGGGGGTRRL